MIKGIYTKHSSPEIPETSKFYLLINFLNLKFSFDYNYVFIICLKSFRLKETSLVQLLPERIFQFEDLFCETGCAHFPLQDRSAALQPPSYDFPWHYIFNTTDRRLLYTL